MQAVKTNLNYEGILDENKCAKKNQHNPILKDYIESKKRINEQKSFENALIIGSLNDYIA